MQNLKSVSPDLTTQCSNCGAEPVVAYWDSELEWYLYKRKPVICKSCAEEVYYDETV